VWPGRCVCHGAPLRRSLLASRPTGMLRPVAAFVIPIITFVLGGFLGHWLAVVRDKRKEFNEAAQPIRAFLLSQEEALYPAENQPSLPEWDTFEACLSRRRRQRFLKALKEYREYHTGTGAYGMVPYPNPEPVHDCVRRLLRFTERR